MNGELGMQDLPCAPRPGPLTAALLPFTILNSCFGRHGELFIMRDFSSSMSVAATTRPTIVRLWGLQ